MNSQSPAHYRMPPEWGPHTSTWLAWPHRRSDWPGKFSPIPWVYAEIVRNLSRFERVNILVRGPRMRGRVESILTSAGADLSRVGFVTCPTDRCWVRDSGPIFVHDAEGQRLALDWHFNAWAKYDDFSRDDRVPKIVADTLGIPSAQPMHGTRRLVLEGGSIDVDGAGLMLTTEECLLSQVQQRNPGLDRAGYEAVFAQYLGVDHVCWLGQGIAGDDTHGHVDDLARFVSPGRCVCSIETNPTDANHEPTREAFERLSSFRYDDGRKVEVISIPMPGPVVFDGVRLPASYANFSIANGLVLVPTFNDVNDRAALGILGELFPDREVVGIHSVDLVWGLGTLHCMTQQEPSASG